MDVCKNPPKPGEYLVRTIEIDGISIGYRVYARSDSTFHVGTYHVIIVFLFFPFVVKM